MQTCSPSESKTYPQDIEDCDVVSTNCGITGSLHLVNARAVRHFVFLRKTIIVINDYNEAFATFY